MIRALKIVSMLATLALPLSAQTGRTFTYDCVGESKLTLADTGLVLRVKRDTSRVSATPCITRTTRDSVPVVVVPPVVTLPPTTLAPITEMPVVKPLTGGWGISDDASAVSVALDPTGLPAMAMRFPAGYVGGSSPAGIYKQGFSLTRIRWEQTVAFPLNYVPHPNMDKSVFVQINDRNTMFTFFQGTASFSPRVGLQEQVMGGSYNVYPLSSAALVRGRRHTLACEAVGNTAGQRNGTLDCWLDGTLVIQGRNIGFDVNGARFTGIGWVPIRGGSGGTLEKEQFIYLAALKVFGQ